MFGRFFYIRETAASRSSKTIMMTNMRFLATFLVVSLLAAVVEPRIPVPAAAVATTTTSGTTMIRGLASKCVYIVVVRTFVNVPCG